MPSRLLTVLSLTLTLTFAAAAQPPSHKGPAAAIALSKTIQPFDVISIKQNNTGAGNFGIKSGDTDLTATNVPLQFLIQFAYDIKPDFITGLAGPVSSARFDVSAKLIPPDGAKIKLSFDQITAMLIPLLADRFHLKVHLDSPIKPVYDLVVAKGGSKIKLSNDEIHDSSWNVSFQGSDKVITVKGAEMTDLADALSGQVGRKVIEKTGLSGHADITVRWSDEVAAQQDSANAVDIYTAVQDQLGLKLVPSKGPVDTLVIDHAEMPTEN